MTGARAEDAKLDGRPRIVELPAGLAAAAAMLPVVLTLGLLAFAPAGAHAALLGVPAAFAGVVLGGLALLLLSGNAVPTAGPSSATALIFAAFVASLVADPAFDPS